MKLVSTLVAVFVPILLGFPVSADAVSQQEKQHVLNAVIGHLRDDYVDPLAGRLAADTLESYMAEGQFDQALDGPRLAELLSHHLQALTGDGHLNVEYSSERLAQNAESDDFSAQEMEKYYGAHLNFGVQAVSRLEQNIGYLDLRVFAPVDWGGDTVAAAMTVLANADALIIDLRNNGGGIGDMADLVASYLFDGGRQPLTGVYDRPTDTLSQRFTQAHVAGKRFGAEKPVYVLISKKTFSAAEALAYNLQALKRATIVGEPSGGGAHPFYYLTISDHFVLWSVTAKSVNPVTQSNWQGTGVTPDVPVPASEALDQAIELVSEHLKNAAQKN